ncbi:hypothetical protein B0O80DRAFT_485021 [Mortierella sp. GBAus27b]|nr:hypothetical protein B0O80DRAFT_485021 [Mortierella sp. GBAus27b]
METTQSFRQDGGTKVLELPCDQDDGHSVIYWDEILDVFPGAQYIKNGNTIVRKLKGTGPDGNKAQRIKHHPGVVLDDLKIASLDTGKQIVRHLQEKEPQSGFEQRLAAFLPPDMQAQVLASKDVHGSIVQAIQDGQVDRPHEQLIACLQYFKDEMVKNNELVSDLKVLALRNNDLMTDVKDMTLKNNELMTDVKDLTLQNVELTNNMIKLQEEMKRLQVQALNQLSLLQNRVQALMTQTYELHEYPIPHLFVILPQDSSSWDPVNLFSNRFRLYFLCECGEHTTTTNTKTPHHIHLAKHEGYQLRRPTEFFKQYGSYVLTILKMLKFGISVAGVAIPAVSLLVRTDALDHATGSLKMLSGNLEKGIDQAIGCLEKLENNEALEGADLRKLESFLNHKDGNKVLGNLFRTVTTEGHVKWVCIDHYRVNYQEKAAKAFRDTVVTLGGTFNEEIGRVQVHLMSKLQAEQFYQALERARSVYELDIDLDWETTQNDFKKLRDAVLKSNIGALKIDLRHQDGPTSDILNRSKRHDPIFDIMRHPPIRSIEILGAPEDFVERSSLLSRNDGFPNLKHMGIDLGLGTFGINTQTLLSRSPNLSSLAFNDTTNLNAVRLFGMRDIEKLGALFESVDSVDIHLRPRIHIHSGVYAEQVYGALEKAKSLHELDISLGGDLTQSDFERLRGILTKTNTGILSISMDLEGGTAGTGSDRIQRHDSIFDIMRHPSTHSVAIMRAPFDFIEQSSLLSQSNGFPDLRHMEIDMTELMGDIPGIRDLCAKAQDLSSLTFCGNIADSLLLRLYVAVSEHQTCPIRFVTRSLCIPPLTTESNQGHSTHQYLAHLLNVGGVDIKELVLEGWTDEEAVVDAFAKSVARIVSRSELRKIEIDLRPEERRAQVLESIQWKHISQLEIRVDNESAGSRAMRALVEGRNKWNGPVELDEFDLGSSSYPTVSAEQAEDLRSFVASTSIKKLKLWLHMTLSDMESVLRAADVSRLEVIEPKANGYTDDEVDGVYDCLADAHCLRRVFLYSYYPTQEQKERMRKRGVKLAQFAQ